MVIGMVLCAACAGTNRNTGQIDGFDVFITKRKAEYDVPGAVVGVVENDTIVFLKGYGVREIKKSEKVDPDIRFQIASVSKFVTGTAIGTLVDEGKLDWDTPIVTYLPEFKLNDIYAGQHATLRDLLAHRTGLRYFDGDLLGRLGYSNSELLKRMQYLLPETSFREKYIYSNAGYFIAGEAVARVDNRSWENLTDERIIRPLGMTRSGAHPETVYLDETMSQAMTEKERMYVPSRSKLPLILLPVRWSEPAGI